MLVPRFGYMGAAYAALTTYTLLLTLSVVVGHKVFAIKFPFKPALQIGASVIIMSLIVRSIPFTETVLGLIGMTVLGGAIYTASILAFDVMSARQMAWRVVRKVTSRA
jgi:O-antigen/teichoic acid export membrane protein